MLHPMNQFPQAISQVVSQQDNKHVGVQRTTTLSLQRAVQRHNITENTSLQGTRNAIFEGCCHANPKTSLGQRWKNAQHFLTEQIHHQGKATRLSDGIARDNPSHSSCAGQFGHLRLPVQINFALFHFDILQVQLK